MQTAMNGWPEAAVDVVTARDVWALHWAREFACDGIAVFLLGPAYAWQWVRLMAHASEPPFQPGLGQSATHPAPAARFALMLAILQQGGESTTALAAAWAKAVIGPRRADPAYNLAHPDAELLAAGHGLAEHCKRLLLTPYTSTAAGSVSATLNAAWTEFLQRPAGFADWEATTLAKLLTP